MAGINVIESSAFGRYLVNYDLEPDEIYVDCRVFLEDCRPYLKRIIQDTINQHHNACLFWSGLKVTMTKTDSDSRSPYFSHRRHYFFPGCDIDFELTLLFEQIHLMYELFQEQGSGWVIDHIDHLRLHLSPYPALRGSSFCALPDVIVKKKAVLNVKNDDNKCFLWSILAHLHPVSRNRQPAEIRHYLDYENELCVDGISFPVELSQIKTFENNNNISVNVYGFDLEKKQVFPYYVSQTARVLRVHLFLHNGHYSLVRNLNRLLSSTNKHKANSYFCERCLVAKWSAAKLDEHLKYCKTETPQRIIMPENNQLAFKNHRRSLYAPMVIYADFEAILETIDTCLPSLDHSSTTKRQHHAVSSYGIYSVTSCCENKPFTQTAKPEIFRGKLAAKRFLQSIILRGQNHQNRIDNHWPLKMSRQDQLAFDSANVCFICVEGFNESDTKDRDHCHLCGKYRGAAHGKCNRAMTVSRDVTVVFHNLRRYDSHFIMQEIGGVCLENGLDINVIPRTLEDYIGFSITFHGRRQKRKLSTKPLTIATCTDAISDNDNNSFHQSSEWNTWQIRFIDSQQFLLHSLEKLVSNQSIDKGFKHMRQHVQHTQPEKVDILLRKGIFPYEYVDSWEKYDDTKLPSIDKFYSSLTNKPVSQSDYLHAQKVWAVFDTKTLGEYSDLYLKCDVLLLADVMENFRATAFKNYGLDPIHYWTLPSYAWDVMLKLTGVSIELVQDADMYSFFEKGIRGGVSMIVQRFAKANNDNATTAEFPFNCAEPKKYLAYLDANNLYGWAMCQKLPLKGFQWMTIDQCEDFNPSDYDDDGDWGCIVEVDLDYPKELHDDHDAYPLAPEKIFITDDLLSPYTLDLQKDLKIKTGKVKKLVPNLMDKKNYVVHSRNLRYYVSMGLKLTRVHRGVVFEQSDFLRPYIEKNTELRKQAKTPAESDQCKLMNNAVFGKTMENVRKRMKIDLFTTRERYDKIARDPLYIKRVHFSDEKDNVLIAAVRQTRIITLDKPIMIGMSILDISKILMFKFHYDYMKKKYGGHRAQLLFTDTDSLCYCIETDDLYEDIYDDRQFFDLSNFDKNHKLFDITNKKVLGKMKIETGDVAPQEFVGLRSKMYSLLVHPGNETNRAKGVSKSVIDTKLRHLDYYNVLEKGFLLRHEMNMFQSFNHDLFSVTAVKVSLSAFDDKRYILPGGVHTFAHGHYATTGFECDECDYSMFL